jgi:hypothetical protein
MAFFALYLLLFPETVDDFYEILSLTSSIEVELNLIGAEVLTCQFL